MVSCSRMIDCHHIRAACLAVGMEFPCLPFRPEKLKPQAYGWSVAVRAFSPTDTVLLRLSTLQSNTRGSKGLCISWDHEIWYPGLSGRVGGGGGDIKAQLCDCLNCSCVLQSASCLVTSPIAQMKSTSCYMLSCMQSSAQLFG